MCENSPYRAGSHEDAYRAHRLLDIQLKVRQHSFANGTRVTASRSLLPHKVHFFPIFPHFLLPVLPDSINTSTGKFPSHKTDTMHPPPAAASGPDLVLLPPSPPPPPPPSAATHHSSLHHVLFPLTSSSPSPLPQVSSPLLFRLISFQFLARKVCCTPSPNSNLSPPSLYYIEFSSVAFLFSSLNLAWISPPWQRHDMLKLFSHPALEQSYQQKLLVHGDRGPIQPTFAAFSEDKWGSSRTSAILHLTTTNPKTHLSFACR